MEEQKDMTENGAPECETVENEKVNNARPYGEDEFLSDLKWTDKLYRTIVIASFILAAASIGIAVMWKVSYGLIGAFVTVMFYMSASTNMLYSRLGFAYTSEKGELTVTELYGKNREEAFVPERLLWLDVTVLGKEACDHKSSAEIRVLHLPRTLKRIEPDAFKGANALERICFGGSEEEWTALEIECELEGVEICFDDEIGYPVKEKKTKKSKKDKKNKNNEDPEESETAENAESADEGEEETE